VTRGNRKESHGESFICGSRVARRRASCPSYRAVVIFTLVSRVRAGDVVFIGGSEHSSHVLGVAPIGDKIRIVTDSGSAELDPRQRIRVF